MSNLYFLVSGHVVTLHMCNRQLVSLIVQIQQVDILTSACSNKSGSTSIGCHLSINRRKTLIAYVTCTPNSAYMNFGYIIVHIIWTFRLYGPFYSNILVIWPSVLWTFRLDGPFQPGQVWSIYPKLGVSENHCKPTQLLGIYACLRFLKQVAGRSTTQTLGVQTFPRELGCLPWRVVAKSAGHSNKDRRSVI